MITKSNLLDTWLKFKETNDLSIRNELIIYYYGMVGYIANRIYRGLPSHVEKDDLISFGTLGLFDAIEKYDPNRGIKFETYATTRIQGSILDELRAADWVPRSIRSKQKAIEKKRKELELLMGQAPSMKSIADELGLDNSEVANTISSSSPILSINRHISNNENEKSEIAETIYSLEEISDLHQTLNDAMVIGIEKIEEKERIVITLYYYEGMTLQEIGLILGVTESRVCQIHSKALISILNSF